MLRDTLALSRNSRHNGRPWRLLLALLKEATASCALILIAMAAHAQQIGQNTTAGGTNASTFSTSSQLVVETVNVKDKSGKFIEGLTAKDFTVTEDGAEQMIRLFEF